MKLKRGEGRWCKLPAESVATANMAAAVKVVARITPLASGLFSVCLPARP